VVEARVSQGSDVYRLLTMNMSCL